MQYRISTLATLAMGAVLATATGWAATQARISGTVTDPGGEPIKGAAITVTSPELPTYTKELKTDGNGKYKVLILDATKRYLFHVEAPGFAPYEERIKVGVGSMDNEIDFTLRSEKEMAAAQQEQLRQQPGYKELDDGFDLLAEGRKAEARTKFQEAVAALPDLLQAWTTLAELDYELKDYEQALAHAEACLELDDESSNCLALAANASNKLGRTEQHLQYMQRYQSLNPDDPATLFNQAVEHLNAMDDEQARPYLEQCLEVDPSFPKCLFEYGMVLLRAGDLEGAKEHLERYLEAAPEGEDAATAQETIKYL